MNWNIKQIFSSAAVAASLLFVGAADATTLSFVVTGDYSASWTMDSQPTPISAYDGNSFVLLMDGNYAYSPSYHAFITFRNDIWGGGLSIEGDSGYGFPLLLLNTYSPSPQLYSGTEGAPVFATGAYALTGYSKPNVYWGNFTLTISAVPEVETYAMLIAGLSVVGVAARRRKKPA